MRHDEKFKEHVPPLNDSAALFQSVIKLAGKFRGDTGIEDGASHSGHEPNNVFLNLNGRQFADLSGVSGFDHRGDGRSVALWDYNRDGRSDLAVVNANAPLLQVFRNEIDSDKLTRANHFIALRLVGGNQTSTSAPGWSSRDAIGTRVELTVDGQRQIRELRQGEGLAAQNSRTLLVGIGPHEGVDEVKVVWPSGRKLTRRDLPANHLLTVFENPVHAPEGNSFVISQYFSAAKERVVSQNDKKWDIKPNEMFPWAQMAGESGGINLFVSMATWCPSCLNELPQLAHLRKVFGKEELGLFGIPIDEKDDADTLARYVSKHRPSYLLLANTSSEDRIHVKKWFSQMLHTDALPSTVITDGAGRVLKVIAGLPTVSQVRAFMHTL